MLLKKCLACDKPVLGRSDKKFCDSQCRSSFNNQLNAENTAYIRKINGILRKNRNILFRMNQGKKAKCRKEKLIQEGFSFNFHTQSYTNKEGKTYNYCYDQGYLLLNQDWVLIVSQRAGL